MKIRNLKFEIRNDFLPILVAIFWLSFFWPTSVFAAETTISLPKPAASIRSFVPNQLIVKYKPKESPLEISAVVEQRQERSQTVFGRVQNSIENLRFSSLGQETPEKKLQKIESKLDLTGVVGESLLFPKEQNIEKIGYVLYKTDGSKSVFEAVSSIGSLLEVEFAKPNYLRKISGITPNDTYFDRQWALNKLEMTNAWGITEGNNEVVVAIVDTGVNRGHEDLSGREFVDGRDYVTCERFVDSEHCVNAAPDPADASCCRGFVKTEDTDPNDEIGHGTHIAGIIGAMTNNAKGVSGLNWNVKILPVRVINKEGYGEDSWILKGLAYAINYATGNHKKMVINMSFGGVEPSTCTNDYQSFLTQADSAGIVVAIAAGNDSTDASLYSPANCQKGIVVASTNKDDHRPYYSNYGSVVDVAAPGGEATLTGGVRRCTSSDTCVLSTIPASLGDPYGWSEGTSMSTGFVSGLSALLLAKNPDLSPGRVKEIIKGNIDQLTVESGKPIGTGRINAYKALLAVNGSATTTPTATAVPTATLTPTVTGTISPTAMPTVTLTPTPTITPTPSCQPTPVTGYKVVLKTPKDSGNCVYSEYRVRPVEFGELGQNPAGTCRAERAIRACP